MAIKHKFDPVDMPEIRPTRTRLLKYYKLNYKATRTERITSTIFPDVDLPKLGIDIDIMDQTTKEAISNMADSIKSFRTAMSKQLEEILFSAASSHYKSAEDECDFDLFEDVIVMAEKYWDRMNTKTKTTKKPSKIKTLPNHTTKTPSKPKTKTPTKSTPKSTAKSTPKPTAKSPSLSNQVNRPRTPKSTTKTAVTTQGLSTKPPLKAADNKSQQPK